jgi:hypothetical protein
MESFALLSIAHLVKWQSVGLASSRILCSSKKKERNPSSRGEREFFRPSSAKPDLLSEKIHVDEGLIDHYILRRSPM